MSVKKVIEAIKHSKGNEEIMEQVLGWQNERSYDEIPSTYEEHLAACNKLAEDAQAILTAIRKAGVVFDKLSSHDKETWLVLRWWITNEDLMKVKPY